MTVRNCMLAVALALLGGNNVYAQFVPLQAKVRETHETLSNGKVVETELKEGSFYRASDGSTLTQWQTVNGGRTRKQTCSIIKNSLLIGLTTSSTSLLSSGAVPVAP